MTSTESVQLVKRVNESAKKSPLKVVSPIIKKYSGHRQGKIKKKLKFPRIIHEGRSKQKKQIKPQLKTILPKTNAGDVIILEPELLPCALNLQKRKRKEDEVENISNGCSNKQLNGDDGKASEGSPAKECPTKSNRIKLLPCNKKKLKCLKNVEASLELLDFDTSSFKEKKEQAFAENYLLKVQQRLRGKDENLYNQFIDLLCNFQLSGISVCDLYKTIKTLFHAHSDLCEDFIAFLTPEQAVECGVFMDHLLLTIMSDFLDMIDIYFSKSPHQIKKIHSVLESLAAKSNLTTDYVVNAVLPLLKGNPVLKDYFLHLLPNGRPPDSFLTDFEEVEYSELNSDISDEEDIMEVVHLPEVDDSFGSDNCPCKCHMEEKFRDHVNHCISCSIKFINGKIFIQHGKLLKPARVVFDDHDMNYHRDRLAPKLYPKRGRKRHRHNLFKDNLSPTKSCNLSSDEFKSDIEDEERGRLKLVCSKSPKINRKKSVSPKHCDKILSRNILNEPKVEVSDSDEKPAFSKSLNLLLVKEEDEKTFNDSKEKVDEAPKINGCDLITFVTDTKDKVQTKAEEILCNKLLDLPKIDMEDSFENPSELFTMNKINDSSMCQKLESDAAVFVEKDDGSHSPPVISIPETATPLFSDAKPILSFLEKLDVSKDSSIDLENMEEKVECLGEKVESGISENKEEAKTIKEEEGVVKIEENVIPWKIEEDRVILQTLQVEENCEETFVKIGKNIPTRSVENIKKRFAELMNMLYEMKAKTSNG